MGKFYFICIFVFGIVLCACQTVSVISIDYLVPAEISFPEQIKRIGIVNNVSDLPGRITENVKTDSAQWDKRGGLIESYVVNGDPKIATESLAKALAAENYFDEVIICDSALQAGRLQGSESYLSRKEVNELIDDLDVDMLVSLEQIQIKAHRVIFPMDIIGFMGSVDAKVLPKVGLYIPNRTSPLLIINGNDSIFWEGSEKTKMDARTNIAPDKLLIAEASDFAGTIPVKYMTPRWSTAQRFLYANNSAQMRDAAFFVQKKEWDKALTIWKTIYEQQKGKKKLRAASNIALYYEIKDDLDEAYEWGSKALELAKVADKISDDNVISNRITDYARIRYNLFDLTKRRDDFTKLRIQMSRFFDTP